VVSLSAGCCSGCWCLCIVECLLSGASSGVLRCWVRYFLGEVARFAGVCGFLWGSIVALGLCLVRVYGGCGPVVVFVVAVYDQDVGEFCSGG